MRRSLTLLVLLALFTSACMGPAEQPPEIIGLPTPEPGAATPSPAEPGVEPTEPSASGPVTISYATWEHERAIYESLAETFMAENPSIRVVILPLDDFTNMPQEGPENPLAMLRRVVSGADTAPAAFVSPEALGSNLLMDLKPLMDADATFQREDFQPGALEQYTVKGSTWLLPRYLYVQLLTYNKELFKQAELPEPQPGWTWDDLVGAAEQLARKNGNEVEVYGFVDPSGGFFPLMSILQKQGIDLLNTPAKDVRLDRPEIVEAIKRVRALNESGALLQPYKMDGPPMDVAQLVQSGRIGIWSEEMMGGIVSHGPGGQPEAPSYSFEVGKLPYPSIGPGFFFGGYDGYIISGGSAHPNEAWKWIEFLSRQQIEQRGMGMEGGFIPPGRVPARKSLAEASGFWNNIDEQTAAAYRWAIEHADAQPTRTPDYAAIGALSNVLPQVVQGNEDPVKALAEAQRQLEEQLAQMQLTPTPTPDTSPVLVATPEPQEAPEGATTITFGVAGYSNTDIRRIARAFREQHPEIFVQVKSTDTFTGPVSIKDVAQTSDCFTWWSVPQTDADFAALLDLQPLFDADPTFPQSDFPAALLSPYQRGGGLFGLPYAFNIRTLNYNADAFEEAGIATPTFQWTPADFLAAAQALTKGEGEQKRYGYVPFGGAQQDMMFFIGQFGGRLTKGSGVDLRPSFDDPKVVEAIQWYIDLAKVHKVMPDVRFPYKRDDPGYEDRSYELVPAGRAGMWFDYGSGFFEKIDGPRPIDGPPQLNFELGVAPLPIGGGGLRSGDFSSRGFYIAAKTQQAAACWEFLKFLSAETTLLQGSIPARASIAASEAFTSQAPPQLAQIAKTYAEALKKPGEAGDTMDIVYGANMDLYWFNKALSATIEEDADLRTGLAEAQKLTTAFMECLARDGKPPACATEVDPTYEGYNVEDPGGPIGIPEGPIAVPAVAVP